MGESNQQHVHVVGIAGVGMSALAQALKDSGYDVSGSDRFHDEGKSLGVLDQLRLAGIRIVPQDGSGIHEKTTCLAVSTAIESDNADLNKAKLLRVPVVHRAAMLARLAAGKRLLAVTGTAGKTTVTGMIGYICAEAGLDPFVVNGGAVTNWQARDRVGNVRKGSGSLWIIEADESDKSLLSFHPHFSVITNISKDHFELDEVVSLFQAFRKKTDGWTILGPQAASVLEGRETMPLTVHHHKDGNWIEIDGHEYPSPMPGRHNAENAMLAVQAAMKLGIKPDVIARALSTFRGIHRRLEVAGRKDGIIVLDDYAHNPAKIAASWLAAAEQADRVIGIWRPHGYAPLSLMFDEFVTSISGVCRQDDCVYIMPVFYAGGTAKKSDDAQRLAGALAEKGLKAVFVENYQTLGRAIKEQMKAGDVILGMGARDPELPQFLRSIL